MIQLENQQIFSYHKEGEAPRPKVRAKHPCKVMVWASIFNKELQTSAFWTAWWTAWFTRRYCAHSLYHFSGYNYLMEDCSNTIPHAMCQNQPTIFWRSWHSPVQHPTWKSWLQTNWKYVVWLKTLHSHSSVAPQQRRACPGDHDILDNSDTSKVLSLHRPF